MARPRLGESERRRRTIGVRVTEAEETELREWAQAACLSMGAYLRRRALGQRVRMAAELRLGAAELLELNRIGVNLNQMARALNSRAVSSPAETQAAVERVSAPLWGLVWWGTWENGPNGLGGSMSVELISVLIAVLAIGATLGGLILTSNRGLRQDMARLESRLDGRIGGLESRLREDTGKMESRLREDTSQLRDDIKQLGERVARMEHGQAKLEGLLEGLREAITGRVKAS